MIQDSSTQKRMIVDLDVRLSSKQASGDASQNLKFIACHSHVSKQNLGIVQIIMF